MDVVKEVHSEELEGHEPSIDSDIQEERIKARRLRIERRLALQRRAEHGSELAAEADKRVEQSLGRLQIKESQGRLRRLHEDGDEMVTNVRVAGDAREVLRRNQDDEMKRQRKDKLEAEEKAALLRFDELSKKWKSALKKEVPQELHEMLLRQKAACDVIIDEKNKLITDYQMDLKLKDDEYVQSLKKQGEDIDLLIERMNEQARELTVAYRTELENIERAFIAQRSKTLHRQREAWEALLEERTRKEYEQMRTREARVAENEQALADMRVKDAEEYNLLKIKLETDIQILQQQLQQMKATYQLNQEKLEYNFTVLRKREEENSITKSQQKRRLTRAHDVLMTFKRKLAKQEKQFAEENQQLGVDCKHMAEQLRDLQRKTKLFLTADSKKFRDIWLMNEEECKLLAGKLLDADRIIAEHQLALAWDPPNSEFMKNVGPIPPPSESGPSAIRVAEKVLASDVNRSKTETAEKTDGANDPSKKSEPGDTEGDGPSLQATSVSKEEAASAALSAQLGPHLIKRLLEVICDESGFLIEAKLHRLLGPLDDCERTLMRLDVIFDVLGVNTAEDIAALTQFFIQFKAKHPKSYASVGVGPQSVAEPGIGTEVDADASLQSDDIYDGSSELDDAISYNPSTNVDAVPSFHTDIAINAQPEEGGDENAEGVALAALSARGSAAARMGAEAEERDGKELSEEEGEVEIRTNELGARPEDEGALQSPMANSESSAVARDTSNTISQSVAKAKSSTQSTASTSKEKSSGSETKIPDGRGAEGVGNKREEEGDDVFDANDVLKALRAFTELASQNRRKAPGRQDALQALAAMHSRDCSGDADYWAQYPAVVPGDKADMWDALIGALDKYYQVLMQRAKVIDETETMRQQNMELRSLLQQYINAQATHDLENRPTRRLNPHIHASGISN